MDILEGVSLSGMALSVNREYLFFRTYGPLFDESPLGFAIYNINRELFEEIFFTDFVHTGPVTFISAKKESNPGLIYTHLRDSGTYAIDLLGRKVKETVSNEYNFRLAKHFKTSPDGQWIVVHKRFSGAGGFHELQFYKTDTELSEPASILNEAGRDSIAIYDFEFSKTGERLFVTYQLSDGRSRGIESYFGSYDLQTGELYTSDLRFPWTLNPYYTAYSPKRGEIYTIGAYQEFYIIDSEAYQVNEIITLEEKKTQNVSQILLSRDENVAFISSPADNLLQMLDLNTRNVVQTIELEQPYHMIIP